MDISVVIPAYNEEESLPELFAWIKKVMDEYKFSYEVILVDDGSTDNTWNVLLKERANNAALKGLLFNKNNGKSAALHVAFAKAQGDVVITMDADLQDNPEEIPALYSMIMKDGFDLVSGWKKKRYDPISKTIPTKLYNYVSRKLSGTKLHDMNCGLKAYKLDVVKNIRVYGEMHRYIPLIAKWAGYTNIGEKVVKHQARKYGHTKFGYERFIRGPLDLLSIIFVSKYKKRPMHFFGSWGIFSFMIGFFSAAWVIGKKIFYIYFKSTTPDRDVVDQPLFYLSLVALVIGVQLFLAGFLGEMVALNNPRRDEYVIKEEVGN